jgi:hypothetical protein
MLVDLRIRLAERLARAIAILAQGDEVRFKSAASSHRLPGARLSDLALEP